MKWKYTHFIQYTKTANQKKDKSLIINNCGAKYKNININIYVCKFKWLSRGFS